MESLINLFDDILVNPKVNILGETVISIRNDIKHDEHTKGTVCDKLKQTFESQSKALKDSANDLLKFLDMWKVCLTFESLLTLISLDVPVKGYFYDSFINERLLKDLQREALINRDVLGDVVSFFDQMGITTLEREFQKETEEFYHKSRLIPMSMLQVTLPEDDMDHIDNLLFYQNKIPLRASGEQEGTLETILKTWRGNYKLLEQHHGYIQWLFPNRELGQSLESQPLTKNEANQFKNSDELKEKVLDSLDMMLDFYGIILQDRRNGKFCRGENYKERYHNLQTFDHNYLRICRILRFLGIIGLEKIKISLIEFFIGEVFEFHEISNCINSLIYYWLPTVCKEEDLEKLENLIFSLTKRRLDRKKLFFEDESWSYQFAKRPLTEEELAQRKQKGKQLALDMAAAMKKKKRIDSELVKTPEVHKLYSKLFILRKEARISTLLLDVPQKVEIDSKGSVEFVKYAVSSPDISQIQVKSDSKMSWKFISKISQDPTFVLMNEWLLSESYQNSKLNPRYSQSCIHLFKTKNTSYVLVDFERSQQDILSMMRSGIVAAALESSTENVNMVLEVTPEHSELQIACAEFLGVLYTCTNTDLKTNYEQFMTKYTSLKELFTQ